MHARQGPRTAGASLARSYPSASMAAGDSSRRVARPSSHHELSRLESTLTAPASRTNCAAFRSRRLLLRSSFRWATAHPIGYNEVQVATIKPSAIEAGPADIPKGIEMSMKMAAEQQIQNARNPFLRLSIHSARSRSRLAARSRMSPLIGLLPVQRGFL